jgi:hypothetical protein
MQAAAPSPGFPGVPAPDRPVSPRGTGCPPSARQPRGRQHPRGKDGIVERKRYHPHCVPTCSLWLNQLERWLGLLSQRAVKRGTCRHVTEPVSGSRSSRRSTTSRRSLACEPPRPGRSSRRWSVSLHALQVHHTSPCRFADITRSKVARPRDRPTVPDRSRMPLPSAVQGAPRRRRKLADRAGAELSGAPLHARSRTVTAAAIKVAVRGEPVTDRNAPTALLFGQLACGLPSL